MYIAANATTIVIKESSFEKTLIKTLSLEDSKTVNTLNAFKEKQEIDNYIKVYNAGFGDRKSMF